VNQRSSVLGSGFWAPNSGVAGTLRLVCGCLGADVLALGDWMAKCGEREGIAGGICGLVEARYAGAPVLCR
jgi:hypothetical protein